MLAFLRSSFVGQQIIDCADQIERVAKQHGYSSVNVMDPTFNSSNIMVDPHRVNVHTDSNSVVISFSIG